MKQFDIIPISQWGLGNKNIPLGIAGPCSWKRKNKCFQQQRPNTP